MYSCDKSCCIKLSLGAGTPIRAHARERFHASRGPEFSSHCYCTQVMKDLHVPHSRARTNVSKRCYGWVTGYRGATFGSPKALNRPHGPPRWALSEYDGRRYSQRLLGLRRGDRILEDLRGDLVPLFHNLHSDIRQLPARDPTILSLFHDELRHVTRAAQGSARFADRPRITAPSPLPSSPSPAQTAPSPALRPTPAPLPRACPISSGWSRRTTC
jgi:hypothetical protein